MKGYRPLKQSMNIEPSKLGRIMDLIVTEPAFRNRLDERPIETLDEIGVTLDDKVHAELLGKRLSELIPVGVEIPGSQQAMVLIEVGIAAGVDVVVEVAVKTSLDVTHLEDEVAFKREVAIQKAVNQLTVKGR